MKNSIRPPKAGKKARTISVHGHLVLVPVRGKVVDAKTLKPVKTEIADQARMAMASKLRSEGEGQPPRRGPTDLLRRHIYFGVEPDSESVVIGPLAFSGQPKLVGAKTVPELLNIGGVEIINGKRLKFGPRPFVGPMQDLAEAELVRRIGSTPLT